MKQRWQSPLVRKFCELKGNPDPRTAVLDCVGALFADSGISEIPIPLEKFAAQKGVIDIESRDMSLDGLLVRSGNGYVIYLNKKLPQRRQRFTLAHEIAHIFFRELGLGFTNPSAVPLPDEEEEKLCDIAAAEMLMPSNIFGKQALRLGPSSRSLLALADDFCTSVHSTAIKFCETRMWKLAIAKWSATAHGFVSKWIVKSPALRVSGWRPSVSSPVARAFSHGYASGFEGLETRDGERFCFVDSFRFGAHVLAVLLDEQHPQYLVAQYEHKELRVPRGQVWGTANFLDRNWFRAATSKSHGGIDRQGTVVR